MNNEILIEVKDLCKNYKLEKTIVEVLKGLDVSVKRGEWVALLGASGSGKTTLLNQMGTLEQPDSGSISYNGKCYSKLSNGQATKFRSDKVGFIFQAYHLLPELTVLENVILPGQLAGRNKRELKKIAAVSLERVGLAHRIKHRPNELSGGEQQRAAIARALINDPELILADEPTGNLDSETGAGILQIFKDLHSSEDSNHTIVMVTHDRKIAALADRIIELKDGRII